jgi:hypothetical protein
MKINVDAAYIEEEGRSCGMIIRNSLGKFVSAACKELPFIVGSMMPEAYALRVGLWLAQQIGCNRFITRSDNT